METDTIVALALMLLFSGAVVGLFSTAKHGREMYNERFKLCIQVPDAPVCKTLLKTIE
jgi:hypothetical protein